MLQNVKEEKFYTNQTGYDLYKGGSDFQVWSDWDDPEENEFEVQVSNSRVSIDEWGMTMVTPNSIARFVKIK